MKKLFLSILKLINYILVALAFALVWLLYYSKNNAVSFNIISNFAVIGIFFIVYIYFVNLYDGTRVSLYRISDMFYSQTVAYLMVDGIMYVVICVINKSVVNILPGLLCIIAQMFLSYVWCTLTHIWYFKNYEPKKTAIIYGKRQELDSLINAYGLSKKFAIAKKMTVASCLKDLNKLDGIETVFINDVHSHERNIIAKYCLENNIEMLISPRLGDVIMSGSKSMHIFHLPFQRLKRDNTTLFYSVVKRMLDILVSLLAIIIASPFMLITSIVIKAYDGGPVLYKQERLTKDAKVFKLYKFRSMKIDAEKETGAVLSSGDNDPRITPVGRFIRKIRLDELPQLFNILKGDMSIVGPRPERPEIAKQYSKKIPEFKLRLQVKAGLTGYAQVYGKYNTTPYNKLKMDLMYIANQSLVEDFKICLVTIKILFLPDSTEGIKDGQKTAMDDNVK